VYRNDDLKPAIDEVFASVAHQWAWAVSENFHSDDLRPAIDDIFAAVEHE
jgi:hypothetical protein